MARTFGEYVHTAHGLEGEFDYARYRWRDQEWAIPVTPFHKEAATDMVVLCGLIMAVTVLAMLAIGDIWMPI